MMSKDQEHAKRRNTGKIILLILALLCLPGYLLWTQWLVHDWNLARYARSFAQVTHPAGSRPIATAKRLGLLVGNGNHCDYFVAQVHNETGTRESVLTHYATQQYFNPIHQAYEPVEVGFIDPATRTVELPGIETWGYNPINDLVDGLGPFNLAKCYYIVYILDSGYDAGIDIRCM